MHAKASLVLPLTLLAAGCINTFDPSLFARDAGGPPADGAPTFDGGPPLLALADYCSGGVPALTIPAGSTASSIGIDTTALIDDVSTDVTACVRGSPTGPDGFARVQMEAGERWHFHFRHIGDANPALYVLDTCDPRRCRDDRAVNLCDQGADEHLSFEAPAAGEYLIGLDTFDAVGLTGTLEIIRPVCGNGLLEHSETCDDGDREAGDGCDEECRDEITSAPTDRGETEVNDDRFSANHVLAGTEPLLVTGRVASRCESDWFVLDVPADASLRAEITTSSGGSCAGSLDVPDPFTLDLLAADGLTVLGTATPVANCPAIDPSRDTFATSLPSGRYYLRLFGAVEDGRTFNYGLRITVTTP
jgi:cysteine-rich repeat protein